MKREKKEKRKKRKKREKTITACTTEIAAIEIFLLSKFFKNNPRQISPKREKKEEREREGG